MYTQVIHSVLFGLVVKMCVFWSCSCKVADVMLAALGKAPDA